MIYNRVVWLHHSLLANEPREPLQPRVRSCPVEESRDMILVVDDDASFRQRMHDILSDAGLDVVLADDGLKALDALSKQEFDLVFLDVMMPGLNGLDTLRILGHAYPWIKVCMLTVLHEHDLLLQLNEYGAVDCLAKPVDRQRVLRTVEKWGARKAV
jgi:CheY-like chemotaxis protein